MTVIEVYISLCFANIPQRIVQVVSFNLEFLRHAILLLTIANSSFFSSHAHCTLFLIASCLSHLHLFESSRTFHHFESSAPRQQNKWCNIVPVVIHAIIALLWIWMLHLYSPRIIQHTLSSFLKWKVNANTSDCARKQSCSTELILKLDLKLIVLSRAWIHSASKARPSHGTSHNQSWL